MSIKQREQQLRDRLGRHSFDLGKDPEGSGGYIIISGPHRAYPHVEDGSLTLDEIEDMVNRFDEIDRIEGYQ